MRTAVFVALAIIIASCTSMEKASDAVNLTAVTLRPPDGNQEDADSLYRILLRDGYEQEAGKAKVTILTRKMVAVSSPNVATNYVAAVIEKVGTLSASIAVFDPAQNMKVVSFITQEFPDAMYFDSNGAQPSGQGSDLVAHAVQLSDGGDVIAITAKSAKQFVKGVNEDEDTWFFALYKTDIFMIHAFSSRFNHHVTGDGNYSKDISSHTSLIVTERKTNGMFDLLLKTRIDESGSGGSHSTQNEERYLFNGKEYTRN